MMKHILITIAAVMLAGCGESQQSAPAPETPTPEPVISIHSAAGLGEDEIVKQHLADGVDINLKDEVGFTPLHKAVQSRSIVMVDVLVAEGADVNAKNNYGSTPLHMAVWKHWGGAIELLIDNGGHINAKNNTGETPLDYTQDILIDDWKEKVISLIRKHGGKTGEELKAEGK
jgi:ankyrin repeat protein